MSEREKNRTLALLAATCGRNSDVITAIKNIAASGVELDSTESQLLANAYRKEYTKLRLGYNKLTALKTSKTNTQDVVKASVHRSYCQQLQKYIEHVCIDLLAFIKCYVDLSTKKNDEKVFWLLLKADFNCYMAIMLVGPIAVKAAYAAKRAFKAAWKIVFEEFCPISITRLTVGLKYGVFLYEIYKTPKQAHDICCKTLHTALEIYFKESMEQRAVCLPFIRKLLHYLDDWENRACSKGIVCGSEFTKTEKQ